MPRTRPIPWLIVLLVAGFLAFSAWSFYRAARGASAVTDADYYSHGLRHNQTMLEQKAAASLGWSAVARLQGTLLTVELRDREHRAVSGARGELTLHDPGRPGGYRLALHEHGTGLYQTDLPTGLTGETAADITFERDGARLQRRLLLATAR